MYEYFSEFSALVMINRHKKILEKPNSIQSKFKKSAES